MYKSKYLENLQKDSSLYQTSMYDSLDLDKSQILHNFFPTFEERKALKERDY